MKPSTCQADCCMSSFKVISPLLPFRGTLVYQSSIYPSSNSILFIFLCLVPFSLIPTRGPLIVPTLVLCTLISDTHALTTISCALFSLISNRPKEVRRVPQFNGAQAFWRSWKINKRSSFPFLSLFYPFSLHLSTLHTFPSVHPRPFSYPSLRTYLQRIAYCLTDAHTAI